MGLSLCMVWHNFKYQNFEKTFEKIKTQETDVSNQSKIIILA